MLLGLTASNSGLSLVPSSRTAYGVLTLDTLQQHTAVRAARASFQALAVFAFLAERLVFLAGLVR